MSRRRQTPEDEEHYLIRSLAARIPHGRAFEAHAHRWPQLIYASAGVMTVWTERGSWIAPPSWAVWAPAGVAHAMRFSGETSLRTLYLRPAKGLPSKCAVIAVSPLLRELILRTVELGMLDRRDPIHAAMAKLIREELRERDTPALDLPLPESPLLRRIAQHLIDAPSEPDASAAIAARFGLGVRTLERRFLAETGMPLGQWRRQARFFHALRQLAAGSSVKAVAADSGYRSTSAFVAAFRAAFQTTPGRYFG